MRLLRTLVLLLVLSTVMACGSKRGPTGGEADTELPTVLSSAPAEMGDISQKVIEIDFSKPMDKASITNSVYIYPPVAQRQISLSRSTLRIQIQDELEPDSYYYVTLSTRLKDLRNNNLARSQTLIFRHGDPKSGKVSGLIEYEDPTDTESPISVSVFSADSLLVLTDEARGSSYTVPTLNPADYSLRAYIDKNLNGRYDETREPFFEESFTVDGITSLDMSMSYVDTTLAQVRRIKQVSPYELEIELSKAIQSFSALEIFETESQERLQVLHQHLAGEKLFVLCEKPDSSRYTLRLRNMEDAKGNLSVDSSLSFDARLHTDEIPPRLLSSNPRNGTTVNDLRPIVDLVFSEIMTASNLKISFFETDTRREEVIEVINVHGRKVRLRPLKDLSNYRSYSIIIHEDSCDYSGNKMENEQQIVFLPIKR